MLRCAPEWSPSIAVLDRLCGLKVRLPETTFRSSTHGRIATGTRCSSKFACWVKVRSATREHDPASRKNCRWEQTHQLYPRGSGYETSSWHSEGQSAGSDTESVRACGTARLHERTILFRRD